jgi:hypothetical protein
MKENKLHVLTRNRTDDDRTGCTCIDHKTLQYSSGTWVLSKEKAESLLGKNIYIHDAQSEPSKHGGVITKVVREESGRYTFFYTASRDCFGVTTGNWGREKSFGDDQGE